MSFPLFQNSKGWILKFWNNRSGQVITRSLSFRPNGLDVTGEHLKGHADREGSTKVLRVGIEVCHLIGNILNRLFRARNRLRIWANYCFVGCMQLEWLGNTCTRRVLLLFGYRELIRRGWDHGEHCTVSGTFEVLPLYPSGWNNCCVFCCVSG